MQYFLWIQDQSQGPFELSQIVGKLSSGEVTVDTPCAEAGAEDWKTVGAYAQTQPTKAGAYSSRRTIVVPSLANEPVQDTTPVPTQKKISPLILWGFIAFVVLIAAAAAWFFAFR